MADKTLVCKDCGNEFVFTQSEQAFYKEKGSEMNRKGFPFAEKRKSRKEEDADMAADMAAVVTLEE